VAWYLARCCLGVTFSELAEHFNLKSHGAIIHGVKHVSNIASVSPQIQRELARLEVMVDEEQL
jgi:chromosomal replication initiation ATPase DnaA